jgi:uncharacterized protein DUF5667
MTPPLISARRAAEDFARVVDGTQADQAGRFSNLTTTVEMLREQETPVARADFVAELRTRLMVAADSLLSPADQTARPEAKVIQLSPGVRRHNRRLAIATAAFVVVGGTAGVAAAAENALPGDPLYPIKRGIESAQVSMNSSDAAKGHDLISQATTRLHEVDGLMSDGDSTSRISHTLSAFQRSATSGADLLFVAYQRDGDPADLAALRGTFQQQSDLLKSLASQAPPTSQPDFAAATALLADLDQQARVLCGNCGPSTGTAGFTDLSSTSSLESLLAAPAAAAAAADQRKQTQSLANKAGEIAKSTPQSTSETTAPTPTTRGVDSSLPAVQLPALSGQGSALNGTVTNVTGGVQGLLDNVSTATGGVLTPVTDTVNGTVDALTQLLQGSQ